MFGTQALANLVGRMKFNFDIYIHLSFNVTSKSLATSPAILK